MANTWKIWANRVGRIEKKHLPKVYRIIKRTYATAAYMVRTAGPIVATNIISEFVSHPDLPDVLKGIYTDAGLFGARWTYNDLTRKVKKMPGQKAANIGRNQSWISEVLNYLRINLLQFAANITATTRDDILKIIENAVREGKGAEDIAREIEQSGLPLSRAKVVARTETIRATNVGHTIGARSLPFEVNKRWSAAKDHRTRHSHVLMNGVTVGESDTFKVPVYRGDKFTGMYDEMQAPGDPKAHPSNNINCRCRVVMVPVRDAQGRPVRRRVANLIL